MPVLAICPFCLKTVSVDRVPKVVCPDCGGEFGFAELQRRKLLVDTTTEAAEIKSAKKYFLAGDYVAASRHFKNALDANQNSYSAQYFKSLCDVNINFTDKKYDVVGEMVEMIRKALDTMSRTNVAASDKLTFITAILTDVKALISCRFDGQDKQFEKNIDVFRQTAISDLEKLLKLFRIDGELIMSFAPDVSRILLEIIDVAISAAYKAVRTVLINGKLYVPTDGEYKSLLSLSNEYCFFAHSYNPYFDTKDYSPDFTQNYKLNDKLFADLEAFDDANRANAKKNVIGDIDAYEKLLDECSLALKLTYNNCYRAMCSRQAKQHSRLLFDGLQIVFRLMTPRVICRDKKRVEIRTAKFVELAEWCDMLTRYLVDAYEFDPRIVGELSEFYAKLYEIVDAYFVPEFDKLSKSMNKIKEVRNEEFEYYKKLLFDGAVSCAPALRKYVDFSAETDKTRAKLVKICKQATEDFLLLTGFKIDELEQSNFYRSILQLSTAVWDENNE